jgi:hypothetical protein
MAGLRGSRGNSTSENGLPRWAKFLIIGGILFIIQFILPDPVEGIINSLLHNPNISLYTGLAPFLKAFFIIWKISGIGLLVTGVVDLFLNRTRS